MFEVQTDHKSIVLEIKSIRGNKPDRNGKQWWFERLLPFYIENRQTHCLTIGLSEMIYLHTLKTSENGGGK